MLINAKAYIIVIVVSVAAFIVMRKPFADAIGAKRFDQWRNAWIIYTTAVFLSPSYWAFIIVSSVAALIATRSETVRPALFFLLATAAPAYGLSVPGFAGINRFILTTPQLFLALIFLLPLLFSIQRMRKITSGVNVADACFVGWLILSVALTLRAPSFTHALRSSLETILTIGPLYYAFSRWPQSLDSIRLNAAALILPVIALSLTTIPEFLRSWHFYTQVVIQWVGQIEFSYVARSGYLRASASAFNSIAWGFICMCAGGWGLAFINEKFSGIYKWGFFSAIAVGLLLSLSRGPWVGAGLIVLVFVLTGPQKMSRLAQLAAAGVVAFFAALATPFGADIVALLPGVGDAEMSNITYRQRLLVAARDVIAENPLFGARDFIESEALAEMRLGDSIIDIVNTYVHVALEKGLVGLTLFCGFFASVMLGLRNAAKSAAKYDPALALYCRAHLATLVGITFTIFTTSSVGHISVLCWSMAGVGVALTRIERVARKQAGAPAAEPAPASQTTEPAPVPQFDWR